MATPTSTPPHALPSTDGRAQPATGDAETIVGEGVITGETITGETIITDSVIAGVIAIAVREVPGVHDLGAGAERALGAIRGAVGGPDLSQGVQVEVDDTLVSARITIVAEYPVPLQQVADDVRAAASAAIQELVGMAVARVDVTVGDLHLPGDDEA